MHFVKIYLEELILNPCQPLIERAVDVYYFFMAIKYLGILNVM